jgi:hypothetical protein
MLLAAAAACESSSGTSDAVATDTPATDEAAQPPDAIEDVTPSDVPAEAPADLPVDPASDPATDPSSDPAADPAAEEAGPECSNEVAPATPIGGPCESDCDCGPGLFCYLEDYPGAKNVCTRECGGDCGDPNEYKCLIFSPKHWDNHNIVHHTICMPSCITVADCGQNGSTFPYTFCPGKSAYTVWEGLTLAASTCQVVKTE